MDIYGLRWLTEGLELKVKSNKIILALKNYVKNTQHLIIAKDKTKMVLAWV
jgi:hypothetical protein